MKACKLLEEASYCFILPSSHLGDGVDEQALRLLHELLVVNAGYFASVVLHSVVERVPATLR